jgi:hypothetical protein
MVCEAIRQQGDNSQNLRDETSADLGRESQDLMFAEKPGFLRRFEQLGPVLRLAEKSLATCFHQLLQRFLVPAPQWIILTAQRLMALAWIVQAGAALQNLFGSARRTFPAEADPSLPPRFVVVPSQWVQPSLRQRRKGSDQNRIAGRGRKLLKGTGCP